MEMPSITSRNDVMPIFGFARNITAQATFRTMLLEPQPVGSTSSQPRSAAPQALVSAAPASPLVNPGIMEAVFGNRFRDREPINEEAFAGATDQANAHFSALLALRLSQAGIGTSPFMLTLDNTGAVRVKGDHPDKARIEQLFLNDKTLANDYRGIAGSNDMVAQGRFNSLYIEAWQRDASVEARTAVWKRFKAMHDGLGQALDQMRWDGRHLVSEGRAYMDRPDD